MLRSGSSAVQRHAYPLPIVLAVVDAPILIAAAGREA
jgi:hypothetical protein